MLKLSRVCEGVVVQQHVPGQSIAVKKVSSGQVLHVEYGNLMSVRELHKASIVMLETEIPTECFGEFSQLLAQARETPGKGEFWDLTLRFLRGGSRDVSWTC